MEGSGGYTKQVELMLSSYGGNFGNVSGVVEDEPDVHYLDQPNELALPLELHYQRMPQSYFQFLGENSSFLHKASTADVSQTIPQPDSTITCFGEGFSEILTGPSYNNSGMASGSNSARSLPDMVAWNLGLQPDMINEDHTDASSNVNKSDNLLPNVRSTKLLSPENQFGNSQHQSHSRSSWIQTPSEDVVKSSHVSPKITVSKSVFLPESPKKVQKRKALLTDKQRRIRIAERIKALQQLLPYPVAGSQTAIMDDVIEYIKYLQHQMKELTQSRLGGEPNFGPLLFVEGHGHYIMLEQMMKEPLEEMVGRLIEFNPTAAVKLLESKGLCFDTYI